MWPNLHIPADVNVNAKVNLVFSTCLNLFVRSLSHFVNLFLFEFLCFLASIYLFAVIFTAKDISVIFRLNICFL